MLGYRPGFDHQQSVLTVLTPYTDKMCLVWSFDVTQTISKSTRHNAYSINRGVAVWIFLFRHTALSIPC